MWVMDGKTLLLPRFDLQMLACRRQECSGAGVRQIFSNPVEGKELRKLNSTDESTNTNLKTCHVSSLLELFNLSKLMERSSIQGNFESPLQGLLRNQYNVASNIKKESQRSSKTHVVKNLSPNPVGDILNRKRPYQHTQETCNKENAQRNHNSSKEHQASSKKKKSIKVQSRVRGRPSMSLIESLKKQPANSPFQCTVCKRPFPRKKSLDAHMLVHNNIRPFSCDFPGCEKAFRQSGQLKTHKRLHTKERPFRCSVGDCEQTFTHANRHCWYHKDAPLKRTSSNRHFDIDNVCRILVQEEANKLKNKRLDELDQVNLQLEIRSWLMNNTETSEPPVDNNDTESIKEEIVFGSTRYLGTQYSPKEFTEDKKRMEGALALLDLSDSVNFKL